MEIKNHKAQKPNLNHIIGEENPVLSIFLRGHLVIEAMIGQLLQTNNRVTHNRINKISCAEKIDLVLTLNLISQPLHNFLKELNKLRNKFAHNLGYDLTENEVYTVIKLAGKVPEIEFTDDMHLLDIKTLYDWYINTAGVLLEMFKHVALDLGFLVEQNGGEFPFDK